MLLYDYLLQVTSILFDFIEFHEFFIFGLPLLFAKSSPTKRRADSSSSTNFMSVMEVDADSSSTKMMPQTDGGDGERERRLRGEVKGFSFPLTTMVEEESNHQRQRSFSDYE
jgi:hypothetical protein